MVRRIGINAVVAALALILVPAALASAVTPTIGTIKVTTNAVVGSPVTFTISGDTYGPDQYDLSQYSLVMVARPSTGPACAASDFLDEGNYSRSQVNQPVVGYTWDLTNVDGPFSETYTYTPFKSSNQQNGNYWSSEVYPGAYRVCAWLDDQQSTDPNVSDALASSSMTVVPAHYTFSMRAPRSIRIGSVVARNLQYETFTFKGGGQTTTHRVIDFSVQPPKANKCAPDIGASAWNKLGENPNYYKSSDKSDHGIPLRSGTHTYRARLGLAAEYGATPGRRLVCAAIYDTVEQNDFANGIKVPQPDGLQALAHAWITVKPLPR